MNNSIKVLIATFITACFISSANANDISRHTKILNSIGGYSFVSPATSSEKKKIQKKWENLHKTLAYCEEKLRNSPKYIEEMKFQTEVYLQSLKIHREKGDLPKKNMRIWKSRCDKLSKK